MRFAVSSAPKAIVIGVLGCAAAILVACGDRNGLLPGDQASKLSSALDGVSAACQSGDVARAQSAAARFNADVSQLRAATVDTNLISGLRQGAATLEQLVAESCTTETIRTQTTTVPTTPQTTPETVPPVTQETAPPPETTPETPPATTPDDGGTTPPDSGGTTTPPADGGDTGGGTPPDTGDGSSTPGDSSDPNQGNPGGAVAPGQEDAVSSVIAGRYELERRLGIGGMSTVQLAFDRRLERHVAVKLLAEHLADDPSFVSRFRREALAAARLVHPNVVQVFDFGLDEAQHQHFIVMEYVQGQSCAQLLRDRGHLDVDEAVEILTQACRGLDYAHRNGVVHRDVKPGNLLRSQDNVVKLADFGIAKATEQSSITQIGSVLGTAAYLAPEQARGEEAGPRADIYSLGVVAYQLLSGRLPYEATSLSELALKQQREAPLRLEDLNPSVPPTLSQAVGIALALEPEGRYHDAEAFGRALRDGARGGTPFAETDPTSHLPQGTAATRVLRGGAAAAAGAAAGAAGAAAARAAADREPTGATRALPRRQPPPQVPARRRVPAGAAGAGAAGAAAGAGGAGAGRAARPGGTQRERDRAAAASRRGSGARRMLALLAIFLLIGAGTAVAIIATGNRDDAVHVKRVVSDNARDAIRQLQDIIGDHTK